MTLGPLYYERAGRDGPPMLFIHPNPLDRSCWLFQMAHLSTWFRCIAVDLPGYGGSPKASGGLTLDAIARACWESVDDAVGDERAVLVGCSIGANVIPYMYRQDARRVLAIILTGAGYNPGREFTSRRIAQYREHGILFRRQHALEDLSPAFRATALGRYVVDGLIERGADVDTIIHLFEALAEPYPEGIHEIACPTLIVSGSENSSHQRAFELQQRIAGSELRVIDGAGHACFLEQPWLFDRHLLEFLGRRGLRSD